VLGGDQGFQMGAGASSTALAPPAKFQTPVVREDENGDPRSLFFCVPMDDKVKAKALQVRPGSEGSWYSWYRTCTIVSERNATTAHRLYSIALAPTLTLLRVRH
jgi:hypothetical protein